MKSFTLLQVFVTLIAVSFPTVEAYWKPKPGLKWNWALGTKTKDIPIANTSYDVIDVDMYEVTKEIIDSMHKANKKVICYFSAGTYEVSRPEAQGMLDVKGLVRNKMEEWNEYWLDIRVSGIKPFMTKRLDLAKEKGCDGIEFDNVDAFSCVNWSDALTIADQLTYDKWLAKEAHNRDMAAGFKNSIELLDDLKDIFDFAINEECNEYNECDNYSVFLDNNIAVFTALYGYVTDKNFMNSICSQVKDLKMSIIIKDPSENLEYDYVEFDYNKHCLGIANTTKTTTTTKKTTTTTTKKTTTTTTKKTTTTTTKKTTTTTTKKTTTTTIKKTTTTTVKKTTTTTKKPTTTTTKKPTTTTTVKKTTTTTKKPTTTTTVKKTTTTKKPTTTVKKTITTIKKTTTKKATTTTKKTTTTKVTPKTTTASKCSVIVTTIIKCY